ncbi:LOW QUALITY PROTEIN: reverse transcriptase, partial [Phytophthora megakarya]
MIHDEPVPLGIRPPLPPDPEEKPEFKLNPGERRQILLDTGTTVSMISLDLARRRKIKLNSQKRVKVSELGGVPSYITSSAQIKITLGWRVVYVMDVWATNIGEGMHVLLVIALCAGVRLGIREGMVGLPDEESILMYGYINESVNTRISQSASFEDCICDPENMQMWPSDMASVVRSKMLYGQEERTNGSPKLLTAHDLVNISDRDWGIEPRTPVARIAEYENIPIVGQFVRPGLRRYMEWQQIIQENTVSPKARVHQETYEQMFRDAAPPAVMAPRYRPKEPERAQVRRKCYNRKETSTLYNAKLRAYSPSVIGSLMAVEVSPEVTTLGANAQDSGEVANSRSCSEGVDEMFQESECDAFQDDPSEEDEDFEIPLFARPGTPLARLDAACQISIWDQRSIYSEGSELISKLKDQLVMLLDLDGLSPECDIETVNNEEPGESTVAQEKQLKAVLERHRKIFLGDGNAAPPPATGVICDLDVGDAKPVAQRPRPVVLKKTGVDIRMYINYRVVNSFIQFSNYPLPLIDDPITGFEGMSRFMSLDMVSGFWAVQMTERAKPISAFTDPFGHFQWVRVPFGLKNAPIIYQQMINNCLWGFVRLSPEEEALVDQDVLDYLKLGPHSPSDEMDAERSMIPLVEQMTVFRRNIPAPSKKVSILMTSRMGRPRGINYVAIWMRCSIGYGTGLAQERIREACHTNFGVEGIRTTPKIVKDIQELPFPSTLKGVQSFLGSLNYYHKFIEDYAVVAASLYELTDDQVRAGRGLSRAKESFEILKRKIYHIAEKEVLAVRVLHVFKNLIEGCPLIIYTRHSMLKWVINSKTAKGRLVPWGVALSQYDLEIRKVCRHEDRLAAIMGAGITPREHLDEVATKLPKYSFQPRNASYCLLLCVSKCSQKSTPEQALDEPA